MNVINELVSISHKKVSWQKTTAEDLDIDYTILLREELATFLFEILEETIEYENPENTKVKIFGKWFNIPRQQVAFGDPETKYKFSGTISMPKPWSSQLLAVRNLVEAVTGHSFNFVLINKYNNGADHIGEHRDNEPDLDPNAPIASLSLGQRRPFVLKHRDARKRGADKRNIPPVKIILENGSLLLMNPPTNKIWYHSLPPKKTATGTANNEIEILKSLKHPNVIQYYKHFLSKRFFCIIMEYATKGNLYDFILNQRRFGYIKQKDALNIFCQILLGLDHIHSKNIIHRDMKCENILITGMKFDLIKIADFGISKLLECDGKANTIIGTPNYLAPEVCDGKPYDMKSDIWSLGCILYELCALERMFEGNISNVVLSIASGRIKEINYSIYDQQIQEVIYMLLTTNPQFRPNTTGLMRHTILMPVLFNLPVELGRIVF
ncbi:nimA-like kinase [Carabus blaptoides fortunei]